MRVKIFGARTRQALEEAVNQWLKTNPVAPDTMRFEYGAVYCEDPVEHIIEHTLVLFYVPMLPISETYYRQS